MSNWVPSCVSISKDHIHLDTKWRILTDGVWFYIECKDIWDNIWHGGLSGTQEYLNITDEECQRAYKRKQSR